MHCKLCFCGDAIDSNGYHTNGKLCQFVRDWLRFTNGELINVNVTDKKPEGDYMAHLLSLSHPVQYWIVLKPEKGRWRNKAAEWAYKSIKRDDITYSSLWIVNHFAKNYIFNNNYSPSFLDIMVAYGLVSSAGMFNAKNGVVYHFPMTTQLKGDYRVKCFMVDHKGKVWGSVHRGKCPHRK